MKTRYNIYIGLLTILLVSCNEDFLERPPISEPSSDSFYKDEAAALMGVTGVYNALHNMAHLHQWEDALTDNERWYTDGGTALYGGLAHGVETAVGNNAYTRRAWNRGYMIIQRANAVIENIEPLTTIVPDKKNRLIAECKFLRGWAYHYLIWRFGDVPLLLNPTGDQDIYPARTPKAKVVEQIYKDLSEAAQYLPVKYTGSDLGRITKGAALGYLAKEYLFNKEWVKAAAEAKKVMDIPDYGLYENYLDLWKTGVNNTKEGLWEIQYWTPNSEFQSELYYRWMKGTAANTGASGQGWCFVLQNLVNAYENSDGTPFNPAGRDLLNDNSQYENRDPRLKISIFCDGMDYFGQTFKRSWIDTHYAWRKYTVSKKDPLLLNSRNAPLNWKMLRYAEVLLIYAEAKNEADGPVSDVHNAVNRVRGRVGMPNLPANLTKDKMRERIYNERRVELCSEGTRLEDLIRWRQLKDALERKHLNQGVNFQITNFEEFRYLWPIHQQEIDVNPNLVQNPGY